MRGLLRVAVLLAGLLLISSCSLGARLAYNNLDWLVQRQLDDYVSLDPAQEQRFEADFARWWQWHRSTQLPAYANALRDWAAQSEDGIQRHEIDAALTQFEAFYLAAMEQGYADFAALLASADDRQVKELRKALGRDLEDYREDRVELDEQKRQKQRIKRVRRMLESRFGRLQDDQKQRIAQWAAQHEDLSEQWYASRQAWLERFSELLASRQEPDLAQRLRPLIFDPASYWEPGHGDAVVRNQLRQLDMLSEIAALATPRQLLHLRAGLLKLAGLCDGLAGTSG